MGGVLLAVDPGIRGCGVAAFEGGALVAAAYVKNPATDGNRAAEATEMARAVGAWPLFEVDALAVEWPRIYVGRIRTGDMAGKDPNDLLALTAVDAAIAALLGFVDAREKVASYAPSEWKGQLPKEVCIARVRTRLAPAEVAIVETTQPASKRHNVWDAVGIGLHHVGRLAPRKNRTTESIGG